MLLETARKIFQETLLRIDVKAAVKQAVRIQGSHLLILENKFEISKKPAIYVVAVGKAAYPMVIGFDEAAREFIKGGVVSGVVFDNKLGEKWKVFAGGHPVPNEESFAAARASFELLKKADAERALIVFLISGGGSAMMDLPRSDKVSLTDLQKFNQILVTSGATIAEINAVRRVVSKVKGGRLALSAPNSRQISLIISDTAAGDVSSVASGPSLFPAEDILDYKTVVDKYDLKAKLPSSINKSLENYQAENIDNKLQNKAYVLLDNKYMLRQAAEIAESLGFAVKIEEESDEVFITEGCQALLLKFSEFRNFSKGDKPICYISGGEFGCKVNGDGCGGRNSETVLRLILSAKNKLPFSEYAILSAGTDGIDGNSPAAGAAADERTLERAASKEMNPLEFLENSDSFSFFNNLGDSIVTGATGTNVRDIRILLAK